MSKAELRATRGDLTPARPKPRRKKPVQKPRAPQKKVGPVKAVAFSVFFFIGFLFRFTEFLVNIILLTIFGALILWYLKILPEEAVMSVMIDLGNRVLAIIEALGGPDLTH